MMVTMKLNADLVCGILRYKFYAYLHKRDFSVFGFAVQKTSAMERDCFIVETFLTSEELNACIVSQDEERTWFIIESLFLHPRCVYFIGDAIAIRGLRTKQRIKQ